MVAVASFYHQHAAARPAAAGGPAAVQKPSSSAGVGAAAAVDVALPLPRRQRAATAATVTAELARRNQQQHTQQQLPWQRGEVRGGAVLQVAPPQPGAQQQQPRPRYQHRHQQPHQQHQQHQELAPSKGCTAAWMLELHACKDWQALAAWLSPPGHPQQPCCRWQELGPAQAMAVACHAEVLAGQRHRQQYKGRGFPPPKAAAAAEVVYTQRAAASSPPEQLQLVLLHVIGQAAEGTHHGDAVAAAQLLRALWRLTSNSSSSHSATGSEQEQHEQQLQSQRLAVGEQLLNKMCARGRQPGGAPFAPLNSNNLCADMSQAVMQLQLRPGAAWVSWFYRCSLAVLQQQQQPSKQQQQPPSKQQQRQPSKQQQRQPFKQEEAGKTVSGWVLVATMQLAHYLQYQPQQQGEQQQPETSPPPEQAGAAAGQLGPAAAFRPPASWVAAWGAAAAARPHPLSHKQMVKVTYAARQLQLQLPPSFWAQHLVAAEVPGMTGWQLLQQLHNLPPQQQLVPPDWLSAAAAALPAAMGGCSSTATLEPWAVLPAAAAAVAGLAAAGWRGADVGWCSEVWRAVFEQQASYARRHAAAAAAVVELVEASGGLSSSMQATNAAPHHWCAFVAALGAACEQQTSPASGSGSISGGAGDASTIAGPTWLQALQHVLTASSSSSSSNGAPASAEATQQQALPSVVAAYGLLVALAHSAAPGVPALAAAVRVAGARAASSPAAAPLPLHAAVLQPLLARLHGGLGVLHWRPLLLAGRALVAISSSSSHACSLAPGLLVEYVEQVLLSLPHASLADLDSAVHLINQLLLAPQQPHADAAASSGSQQQQQQQQQERWQQQQLHLRLLQLLQHSLSRVQQQQQQQQDHGDSRAATQLLHTLLALAAAQPAACRPSSGWWRGWYAAANTTALEHASVQQLLRMHTLLCEAGPARPAQLRPLATAAAARRAAVTSPLRLDAAAAADATSEQQQQEGEDSLVLAALRSHSDWLAVVFLPVLASRVHLGLSLSQHARLVRVLCAAGEHTSTDFLHDWSRACISSMQHVTAAVAAAAWAPHGRGTAATAAAAAAAAAAAPAESVHTAARRCYVLLEAVAASGWQLPPVWEQAAGELVAAVVTATPECSAHQMTQQHPAAAAAAARCVVALSGAAAPSAGALQQLQAALPQLLPHLSAYHLGATLWAFAGLWRTQPHPAFVQACVQASLPLLSSSSSQELRLLAVSLAHVDARELSPQWLQAYLTATAAAMAAPAAAAGAAADAGSKPAALLASQGASGQARPGPGFVANTACSLALLQVHPSPAWQQLWRQQVDEQLHCMDPDELIDCLYAAAVWGRAAKAAAVEAATAPSSSARLAATDSRPAAAAVAAAADGPAAPLVYATSSVHTSGSSSSSSSSSSGGGGAAAASARGAAKLVRPAAGSRVALLPRPRFEPNAAAAAASAAAAAAAASAAAASNSRGGGGRPAAASRPPPQAAVAELGLPPKPWLQKIMQQLRGRFAACKAKQLTVALWSLGQLGLKAPVDWLDALYDSLLLQLGSCSAQQLLQLLQGLLHQQYELAPARFDAVLDACLLQLQHAAGSRTTGLVGAAQRQELSVPETVWLLQAVTQLRHQPQQEWCAGVAAATQRMLQVQLAAQSSSSRPGVSSSSSSAWTPAALSDMLQHLMLLDFELSGGWVATFRAAVQAMLPHFTGKQLALLLSSATQLRWFTPSAAASHQHQHQQQQQQQQRANRVFLRRVLLQLKRHLRRLPPTSLGLAGVAVGQLGLIMDSRLWVSPYIAQVTAVVAAATRMPAPQAADLQRSIQYLAWTRDNSMGRCSNRSRSSTPAGRHMRLPLRGKQRLANRGPRQPAARRLHRRGGMRVR